MGMSCACNGDAFGNFNVSLKYILTGDFNVNILPQNRISLNYARPDPSRLPLLKKLDHLVDTQILASIPSLQTFSQNTKGNRLLLTKLDYIFLSENFNTKRISLQTLSRN